MNVTNQGTIPGLAVLLLVIPISSGGCRCELQADIAFSKYFGDANPTIGKAKQDMADAYR